MRGTVLAVLGLVCLSGQASASALQIGDPTLALSGLQINTLPGGNGSVTVGGASTGVFAPLAGSTAHIKSIDAGTVPVNQLTSLPNYVSFVAAPTLHTDITFLFGGVGGAAMCSAPTTVGQTCTPTSPALVTASNPTGASPLTLVNTHRGSFATFSIAGVTSDGVSVAPTTGVIAAQFGTSYQSVLADVTGGNPVAASYSATYNASAGTSAGTLQVGASILSLSRNGVDFHPAGGGTGTVDIGLSSTDAFAPLASTAGIMKDISFVAMPVNSPFLISDLLTIAGAPNLHFSASFLYAGFFPNAACGIAPAPGETCTFLDPTLISASNPTGTSPYSFIDVPNGSVVSFELAGTLTDDLKPGWLLPYDALFTAQFDMSYQSVLATIFAGGAVDASYSATFTTIGTVGPPTADVPEPSPILLLGFGLIGAGWLARRKLA